MCGQALAGRSAPPFFGRQCKRTHTLTSIFRSDFAPPLLPTCSYRPGSDEIGKELLQRIPPEFATVPAGRRHSRSVRHQKRQSRPERERLLAEFFIAAIRTARGLVGLAEFELRPTGGTCQLLGESLTRARIVNGRITHARCHKCQLVRGAGAGDTVAPQHHKEPQP